MDRGIVRRRTTDADRIIDVRGGEAQLLDTAIYDRVQSTYERRLKPVLDFLGALVLIVLTSPVLLVCMALIRWQMGSPVILRQTRIGRHGKAFTLYKLRTMEPDRRQTERAFDGEDRRRVHKSPRDPRITSLGRILRTYSLDELPQFWNVLKGDMSLVGPRPELPSIVLNYQTWQHRRHAVKPGVTGLWQVSERGDRLLHEATELDLEYIESLSLGHDLRILVSTPVVMFGLRPGF